MDDKTNNPVAKIPEELNIPVGEVIRTWREYRGLSITNLAEMAKLTKGYISQVENEKIKRPGDQQLAKLAGALEIEVWDIIARRMPSSQKTRKNPNASHTKINLPDISLPFETGALYFPQTDDADEEAIIKNLRRLLNHTELDQGQRAEFIELINSFIAWLEFRIRSAN